MNKQLELLFKYPNARLIKGDHSFISLSDHILKNYAIKDLLDCKPELISLEDITDEDALELFNIEGVCNLQSVKYDGSGYLGFWLRWNLFKREEFKFLGDLTIKQGDFLRRKSYNIDDPNWEYSVRKEV